VEWMERSSQMRVLVRDRWGEMLEEIGRTVVEREQTRTPPPGELLAATGESGLLGLSLPRELGGSGENALTWGMALEQIGYLCADSALPLIINHMRDIANLVWESGRGDLIERYALPIIQGRMGAGIAYTENTDAFHFNTIMRPKNGAFLLSGYKSYVTGGLISDVFLTYALDDDGDMQAVLVETDDPGVSVAAAEPMGMRTAGASSITFDSVYLPADRVLEATDGLAQAQRFLSFQRLWVTCAPLGRAQAILEDCVTRLSGSVRMGQRVAGLKNVEATLGRMYVEIETARAVLYNALQRVSDGQAELVFDPVVAAARYFACNQIRSVLEQALRILGGDFFYDSPHFGRYMSDFVGLGLVAGTQDIIEVNLGAGVVARNGRPVW
jgi:alkylation response protein AidB-like acyl-CoA dehydrogenase